MKRLLLTLSVLICSAAVASENSGNIRNTIIVKAAEKTVRLAAESAETAVAVVQETPQHIVKRSTLQAIFDTTKNAAHNFVGKASELGQLGLDTAKTQSAKFELKNKANAFCNTIAIRAQKAYEVSVSTVGDSAAFKYAQNKYTTALNSDMAQKALSYAQGGIELIKEHPKTTAAIAAGVAMTAYVVRRLYTKTTAALADINRRTHMLRASRQSEHNTTTTVQPQQPIPSIYPTEDMESYSEFVIARDQIDGNTPSIYPKN